MEVLQTRYRVGNTVLVLKSLSQFDVGRTQFEDVAVGLRELGYTVHEIDAERPYGTELVTYLNGGDVRFVFDGQGVGTYATTNGEPIWDKARIPLISFCGDSPIYLGDRLSKNIRHWLVCFFCEPLLSLYRRSFPQRAKAQSGLLPFASRKRTEGPLKPLRERKLGLVFAGSYYSESMRVQSDSPLVTELLAEVIEEAIDDGTRMVIDVLSDAMTARGVEPQDLEWTQLFTTAQYLERRVRAQRRVRLVSAIKRLPLHLFGKDEWKGVGLGDNVEFHATRPYPEMGEVYAETKINIGHLAGSSGGLHERAVYSMFHGAANITDRIAVAPTGLEENESIFFFDWKDLDHLEERLESLLADDKGLSLVAERGRVAVEEEYSPVAVARRLIALADRHHYWLALPPLPP